VRPRTGRKHDARECAARPRAARSSWSLVERRRRVAPSGGLRAGVAVVDIGAISSSSRARPLAPPRRWKARSDPRPPSERTPRGRDEGGGALLCGQWLFLSGNLLRLNSMCWSLARVPSANCAITRLSRGSNLAELEPQMNSPRTLIRGYHPPATCPV
jgi:hypothetical protein